MKNSCFLGVSALALMSCGHAAGAILINEYNPNPTGDETVTSFVELLGTPGASLDGYFLITIDSDGGAAGALNGDLADLTGITFDSNGLATVSGLLADLENPTHTLVLSQGFTGTPSSPGTNDGTDLDTDNNGVLDVAFPGTVVHALSAADDTTSFLYASQLGGTDLVYPTEPDPTDGAGAFFDTLASDEAQIVFRDRVTGEYYQGSEDFTLLSRADGTVVADGQGGDDLTFDIVGPTQGSANPTSVPEPGAGMFLAIGASALLARRSRSARSRH